MDIRLDRISPDPERQTDSRGEGRRHKTPDPAPEPEPIEDRYTPSEQTVLYLTTTGRKTGLPREIEIWFVECEGRLYVLAEHFREAHWVRNIEREPRVQVRLGGAEHQGQARVLDEVRDRELYRRVQELARQKYDWGEGLPVEITLE